LGANFFALWIKVLDTVLLIPSDITSASLNLNLPQTAGCSLAACFSFFMLIVNRQMLKLTFLRFQSDFFQTTNLALPWSFTHPIPACVQKDHFSAFL